MASLRDIRQKIKSVTATQQITNAMKMMSTAKLSRAIEAVNQTKPYVNKLLYLARSIKSNVRNFSHPAFEDRKVLTSTTIVIGGERGLCGGFNQELHRFALDKIKKEALDKQHIYVIGEKPIRFLQNAGIEIEKAFPSLNIKELEPKLNETAKELYDMFISGKTDRINVIYTSYISSTKHPIVCQQVLPVPSNSELFEDSDSEKADQSGNGKKIIPEFEFLPSPAMIYNHILPRYMYNCLIKAVLESVAAEQCSRMIAMTSATDRANEKIEELQLELNRSRQALITQELNEVIAGSQT